MSSKDLELRERLNRPVIKVVQRHPGNQMPEAQYIVRVCDKLSAEFLADTLSTFCRNSFSWEEKAIPKCEGDENYTLKTLRYSTGIGKFLHPANTGVRRKVVSSLTIGSRE